MRITDKHIFFWGGWPSNWEHSEFDLDGHHFFNTEQYFMYIKAMTFDDHETAEKILKTSSPKKAKDLGREVKNYDDKVWDKLRYKVMLDANKAKYSQNEDLKNLMLNPELEGKTFCEASKFDSIWGVKMTEDDPLIDDERNWKGQNLLGKVLNETREWLKKQGK